MEEICVFHPRIDVKCYCYINFNYTMKKIVYWGRRRNRKPHTITSDATALCIWLRYGTLKPTNKDKIWFSFADISKQLLLTIA